MPINDDFMRLARNAHQSYTRKLEEDKKRIEEDIQKRLAAEKMQKEERERLEEEKKRKGEVQRKGERLKRKLADVDSAALQLKEDMKAANRLLAIGTEKLKQAIGKKDFLDVNVAQSMLNTAQEKITDIQSQMEQNQAKQRKLNKKKETLFASVLKFDATDKPSHP